MKKSLSIFLSAIMVFCFGNQIFAAESNVVDDTLKESAQYIYKSTSNPTVASIGGEWAIIGLARSGEEVPEEYYHKYYENVKEYVKSSQGVLHKVKYTEYSRVILALTAIGKDPSNVEGYNLLTPLGDYEKTIWQGLNGPIWALIALDSGDYIMPQNPDAAVQATREMYIERILSSQLSDGGWSLDGAGEADPDVTGMALQALSKYQDDETVKKATEKALDCMSQMQGENGGFSLAGTENSESCVQMIVALCELGISIDDERFVKNGNSMFDNLMTYYVHGGGFKHTPKDNSPDRMASEQGLYAMVSLKRGMGGKNSLYRMDDAIEISDSTDTENVGLDGKNPDVKKMNIVLEGKTFSDIASHESRAAIEALAVRNIINGKSENEFEPLSTMTRAEFATIIVRGLGLPTKSGAKFSDVKTDNWFFDYVNTANYYGIVKGVSETRFNPMGTISREEAAVMVVRAAKLCGSDTEIDTFAARDILAGFLDYPKASDWAVSALAFCYGEGILSDDAMEICPKEYVTRAEIAQMLFNMLSLTKLI